MQGTLRPAATAPSPERRGDAFAFALLTAFAFQLYTIPGEWIPALQPLRLALVTTGLAAGAMVVRRLVQREPIALDGLRGATLFGFVLLGALSVTWAVNPEAAQTSAIDLAKAFAIYLTIVNVLTTPRRLYIFVGALILGSVVTSVGAIQWYLKGENLVEGFRARWVGTYADPNYLAEHLGIIVPMAVAFFTHSTTRRLMKVVCLGATVLAMVAIVYTHSRGGFLGLSLGMALWAFRERARRMQALAVGTALAIGLVVFAPKSFWARNETVGSFQQDASAMGRVYAWNVASKMSIDRPLLGVGLASFQYAWPLYAPAEARRAYVAHNLYVGIIGELGFVGLFLYLLFSGAAIGGAVSASYDPEVGWIARGIVASATTYLTCNLFAGSLAAPHLYVLVGVAAVVERLARRAEADQAAGASRTGAPGGHPPPRGAGNAARAWSIG